MFYLFLVYTAATLHMASFNEIKNFSVVDLCNWLEAKEDITTEIITNMETNRVNGRTFVDLNEADLREMFPALGDRKAVQRIVHSTNPGPQIVSMCMDISHLHSASLFWSPMLGHVCACRVHCRCQCS